MKEISVVVKITDGNRQGEEHLKWGISEISSGNTEGVCFILMNFH